jgi:hypothetical protein
MKTFIVLFTLCFIGMFFICFSFTSCHKNQKAEDFPVPLSMKASMKPAASSKRFSKTAGSLFSRDTLKAWVSKYKQTFKTSSSSCAFNSGVIRNICATSDAAGVMFYNVNMEDNWGLVAIGVSTSGQLMKADSVISSDGNVSWAKAMEMVSDYQATHANGIWGEFFGSISLENFIVVQNVQNILVQMGLNSKGPRFVLTNAIYTVNNPSGVGMEEGTICPPVCP